MRLVYFITVYAALLIVFSVAEAFYQAYEIRASIDRVILLNMFAYVIVSDWTRKGKDDES